MVSLLKPPADVDQRDLFELLSERRPKWPIDVHFTDAPDVQLYAQAMTPLEWAHVRRDGKAALLYALCTDEGRVFERLSDVGELRHDEAKRLASGLAAGLAVCAPTFGRVDLPAWEVVLRQGAERSGAIARGWYDAAEVLVGMGGVGRDDKPERYHGVPVSEVLDGHRMVQAVCRQLIDSRR